MKPCIETCISDADCRPEDGYLCALGGCFPPPHEPQDCDEDSSSAHCHGDSDGPEVDDVVCDDRYDNDADGLIDCEDEDCALTAPCTGLRVSDPCLQGVTGHVHGCGENAGEAGGDDPATCSDGIDDDLDGHVDCQDKDCAFAENCRGHGHHGGGDGGDQREQVGEGGQTASCDDQQDNDDDGDTDCEDSECSSAPACGGQTDPFRYGEGVGTSPVTCIDGRDNDRDGVIDCDDEDCADFRECIE